ncbi:MAG: protein phosphatase CheZ [Rhodospirillaceae bacterium]
MSDMDQPAAMSDQDRAELEAAGIMGQGAPEAAPEPTSGPVESGLQKQLLDEIKALRTEVAEVKQSIGPGMPPAEADEAMLLRIEIASMIRSLAAAKREIAEIKHPLADEDRVQKATLELDAIVGATETATHKILDASEKINEQVEKVLGIVGEGDELEDNLHIIANETFVIMESCNFQDLTGQRITKVVQTLNFIENRIRKIIEDFGVEAFADLPLPELEGTLHSTDDLVNGPQIEQQALSQDDIDALFG